MDKNVKIPLSLLNRTIDLLEYIDVTGYSHPIPLEYEAVLSEFRKKKQSLYLRQSYADIIFADNEDKRFDARMKYLKEKRELEDW